jgi:hypothetical protein
MAYSMSWHRWRLRPNAFPALAHTPSPSSYRLWIGRVLQLLVVDIGHECKIHNNINTQSQFTPLLRFGLRLADSRSVECDVSESTESDRLAVMLPERPRLCEREDEQDSSVGCCPELERGFCCTSGILLRSSRSTAYRNGAAPPVRYRRLSFCTPIWPALPILAGSAKPSNTDHVLVSNIASDRHTNEPALLASTSSHNVSTCAIPRSSAYTSESGESDRSAPPSTYILLP